MDFNKDYYAILGVLPTTELVVIKAAYKAMFKVYHPDKFNGSKAEAHAKTIEINEAYSILININKRKEYDESRDNNDDKAYSYKEESKTEDDFSSGFYTLEKDWQVAIKYQPELVGIVDALSKISSKLAFTYKAYIIELKAFDQKTSIADKMEQEYLSLYFGTDKQIQVFAKALIISNHRDAARELNKAITVLGKGVDVDIVIKQIKSEFNLYPFVPTKKNDAHKGKESDTIEFAFL